MSKKTVYYLCLEIIDNIYLLLKITEISKSFENKSRYHVRIIFNLLELQINLYKLEIQKI